MVVFVALHLRSVDAYISKIIIAVINSNKTLFINSLFKSVHNDYVLVAGFLCTASLARVEAYNIRILFMSRIHNFS